VAFEHNGAVAAQEIDQYLEALEEPKRGTLALLRRRILDVLPDAEQGMSYGVPAFKVGGKTIAGFAAFKDHLSYLPHSGSVFPQLADELTGYTFSAGALRFDVDRALPAALVERLVEIRLRQAFPDLSDGICATNGRQWLEIVRGTVFSAVSCHDSGRRPSEKVKVRA
jgi:uncharacterized protein YdhG (YjbR/CyaY superfamily)